NNIVSNLRNLKTAALALYVDKLDDWESSEASKALPTIGDVTSYMGQSGANDYSDYVLAFSETTKPIADQKWYIVYNFGTGGDVARVKEKLAGRAKSTGLQQSSSKVTDGSKITLSDLTSSNYSNMNAVVMQIR
ncbi:MAG: hypothetical protein IJ587_10045, partial [Synergistaceae bacterium]|nr:hypothetical protein [Synergistaceae bacterium]